ncbi:hypothetical protein SBA3_1820048 [Candidatus Sulfopaludibacter sp. SbA3]|nr:hypothetical protein SBA3_1820048 [Candidatus Sulfopaludibacter sp. SbA3]
MLQNLLKERFKLTVHKDEKVISAFVLTVSKKGPKLKESEPGLMNCGPGQGEPGRAHVYCQHLTSADMADAMMAIAQGYLQGTPVIDQTGIKGTWEFKLDWTPAARYNAATRPADGAGGTAVPAAPDSTLISFFDAVEAQLGLSLENRKVPVPVIVVDHLDRVPIEN